MKQDLERLLAPARLVTGNPGKARELRRICGVEVAWQAVDLREIQDLDLIAVARAKGEEARGRLGCPVIVDETGLELAALNGFPGPLVKWMLEAVGAEGIARTAASLADTRATAHCVVLYSSDEVEVWGEGTTSGRLVLPPRGHGGFGWDPVFLPAGEERTYAELPADRKDEIGHRGKAWRALMEGLRA